MDLQLWVRVKKTVYGMEKHWLSGKEKVLGEAVNKDNWFPWKKFNSKQYFLSSILDQLTGAV